MNLPGETREVRFDFKYENLKALTLLKDSESKEGGGRLHTKTRVDLRLVHSPLGQAPSSWDQSRPRVQNS